MSRSLDRVTWNNSSLIQGDVVAELRKLRQQPGRTVQTWGMIGAAVLFGTTGTAQALGPASAPPLSIGSIRLVVGAPAIRGGNGARADLVAPGRAPHGGVAEWLDKTERK